MTYLVTLTTIETVYEYINFVVTYYSVYNRNGVRMLYYLAFYIYLVCLKFGAGQVLVPFPSWNRRPKSTARGGKEKKPILEKNR